MIAKNIKVCNFRNISKASLDFHPELTVLHGNNAQGKTNLLEAVFTASWGKSFRAARETELIKDGADEALTRLVFDSAEREQEICCRFFREGRHKIEINGIPAKKTSKIYGKFAAVLFVPAHLEIVRGAPEERRKFIDMALCREQPSTLKLMNNYRRALEQRNRVLKDAQRFSGLDDLISVWDAKITQFGCALSAARAEICERLSVFAARIYSYLSGGEELSPRFVSDGGLNAGEYAEKLTKARGDDARLGYTTVGAHRDDLKIFIGGRDGQRFASQGQQRSAVIALKLAEAELLNASAGEPPVLLLDDVLSELDTGRRGFLLERMSGMQRIVTACDPSEFGGCALYEVENGVFTRT